MTKKPPVPPKNRSRTWRAPCSSPNASISRDWNVPTNLQQPLAFKAGMSGTVALFRFGAAVFIGMNPLEEEVIIKGIDGRLIDSLAKRESETMQVFFKPDGEDQPLPNGSFCLKND